MTARDEDWADGSHPVAENRAWIEGQWRDRISLAGSETSPTEPGYLAGAVLAAERAVAEVKRRIGTTPTDARTRERQG